MDSLKKNFLDLRHSFFQTKGALFFGLGIGGGIALFFGAKQMGVDIFVSFFLALFFSFLFIYMSIKKFNRCKDIQGVIRRAID